MSTSMQQSQLSPQGWQQVATEVAGAAAQVLPTLVMHLFAAHPQVQRLMSQSGGQYPAQQTDGQPASPQSTAPPQFALQNLGDLTKVDWGNAAHVAGQLVHAFTPLSAQPQLAPQGLTGIPAAIDIAGQLWRGLQGQSAQPQVPPASGRISPERPVYMPPGVLSQFAPQSLDFGTMFKGIGDGLAAQIPAIVQGVTSGIASRYH